MPDDQHQRGESVGEPDVSEQSLPHADHFVDREPEVIAMVEKCAATRPVEGAKVAA